MVTTKRCAYGTCKNDSRNPARWVRNAKGDPVKFCHFPGPTRQNEKRQRWIRSCHPGDSFVYLKDSYICSIHFDGGNGPTQEEPDPISAVESEDKVKHLSQKRKSLAEREAKKLKSKKICFKKTAAKGLLLLHQQPIKSKDDLEATEALLDLLVC